MANSNFIAALQGLASITRTDVGDDELELFDVFVLRPHGEVAAQAALAGFLARSGLVFPVPGQLLEHIPGRTVYASIDLIEQFIRWRARPQHVAA